MGSTSIPTIQPQTNASNTSGEVRYRATAQPTRTVCLREEFRTPLGVRKSPKNEPAVCGLSLWGFEDLAVLGRAVAAVSGLAGIGMAAALSCDRGADPRQSVRKAGDGVWDRRAEWGGRAAVRAGCRWSKPQGNDMA